MIRKRRIQVVVCFAGNPINRYFFTHMPFDNTNIIRGDYLLIDNYLYEIYAYSWFPGGFSFYVGYKIVDNLSWKHGIWNLNEPA